MESELVELFQAVKKAADAAVTGGGSVSSPEEERCLDALGRLKKFPVNYQLLVSTQVGKQLRHLTKHPRKKIQGLASEVVEIWKNIVIVETGKNKKNGIMDKGPRKMDPGDAEISEVKKMQKSIPVKVEKEVPEVRPVKVERQSSSLSSGKLVETESFSTEEKIYNAVKVKRNSVGETVKPEKVVEEGKQKSAYGSTGNPKLTSVIYCNDAVRDKIRELLSEALCKVPGEVDDDIKNEASSCDPYRVAVSVESAMFQKWGRSNGSQKVKYRSIMFNIKDPKNPDFRRKVLLGHFKPESVPELTAQQMASDQRQKQNEQIKEKALFDCERGMNPKATTDQFKCGRCGKRQCTYYQMQTRSADEPMTTYVTCVNCNNHWKFC